MTDFEKLTSQILALPSDSRARLAELLIQSLEEGEEEETRTAWLVEIHRRYEEIVADAAITLPVEEILREACRRNIDFRSGLAHR